MTDRPVILIGWDGASPDIVRRLLDDGRLPELAAVLAGGSWIDIESYVGLGDDANWTSIATGVRPEVHGRFNWAHSQPNSYGTVSVAACQVVTVEPFWTALGERGHSVFVLDMPKGPLSTRGPVEQVSDWTVHGADTEHTRSFPADLAERWIAERGETAPELCFDDVEPPPELAGIIDDRRQMMTEALVDRIQSDHPDLIVAVYAAAHCRSHKYWHLHDDALPDGDPIVEEFMALDRDLGRLRAESPQARFGVFTALGMGPSNHHDDVIRQALDRLSAEVRRAVPGAVREPLRRDRVWKLGRRGYNAVTRRLPARLKRTTHVALGSTPIGELEETFRRRVRPFGVVEQNSVSTPIRLNIIDRDPAGLIRPEAVGDVSDWLSDELKQIIDPETGRPIVDECVVVATEYPGSNAHVWADLLAVWSDAPSVARVLSPTVGEITRNEVPWRSGEHRPQGWLIASEGLIVEESAIDPAGVGRLVGSWLDHAGSVQ